MRLVFAGTPEFARVALDALLAAGHDIPLVLTQPDRPAGRGLKLTPSPVMQAALAVGGTSFDRLYVNVNGESGYFERSLDAYGRRGEPCRRCGAPIRRDEFMNRSSYSCPVCQPRPRRARY